MVDVNEQNEDNRDEIEISLSLEDWGRIAILSHKLNMTINQCVEHILREYLDIHESKTEVPSLGTLVWDRVGIR